MKSKNETLQKVLFEIFIKMDIIVAMVLLVVIVDFLPYKIAAHFFDVSFYGIDLYYGIINFNSIFWFVVRIAMWLTFWYAPFLKYKNYKGIRRLIINIVLTIVSIFIYDKITIYQYMFIT